MATTSSMFMYSLTIQPPSAITQAVLGQFAGTKEQQIVTASGSKLTIHRPDPTQGKISALFTQDCFGIIRTLAAFRLAGSSKGKRESHNCHLLEYMLMNSRLHNCRFRLWQNHNPRIPQRPKSLQQDTSRDLWQIWNKTSHSRAIPRCRPQR